MTNLWKVLLLLLCTGYFMTACNDDDNDNPFVGTDNHILSFSLEKGENKWQAAIVDNEIVLTVPEGTELKDSKVDYKLSEQANITPDPATITAWDEERQFSVTSYNGTSQTYKYTIRRSAVSETGNFTLNSQTEVDAFIEKHQVSVIEGNLYIATTESSEDPITNLDALKGIKEITYGLTIDKYYRGATVTLPNIEKTGSISIVSDVKGLPMTEVSFPKLQFVGGSLSISLPSNNTSEHKLKTINIPSLETVLQDIVIDNKVLETVNFNSLRSVEGELKISPSTANEVLERLEFPALQVAGSINLTRLSSLNSFSCPSLESCGNFTLLDTKVLSNLNLPKLATITGTILLQECTQFDNWNKPFQYLKSCNCMRIVRGATQQEINISGKGIKELSIEYITKFKISGDGTFDGNLIIVDAMPEFNGISKIGGLTVKSKTDITFTGITEITGSLLIGKPTTGNVGKLHLPDLITLGEFDATEALKTQKIPLFDCPELTTITGDFIFVMSFNQREHTMEFYQAPKLTTIRGSLKIAGNSSANTKITDISCLEALTTVGKVDITNLKGLNSLKSFDPLKKVAENIQDENNWNIENCGYNPTLTEMKTGSTENPANY